MAGGSLRDSPALAPRLEIRSEHANIAIRTARSGSLMSSRAPFDPANLPTNLGAWRNDPRVVLVLDAGGTSFRFDAIQGGRRLLDAPRTLPSHGDDLARSLRQLTDGFAEVHAATGGRAVALSLAFP